MKRLTRREFIYELLLIAGSTLTIGGIANAAIRTGDEDDHRETSPIFNECAEVYKEWMNKEGIGPAEYLISTMSKRGLEPWKISEATKLDIQDHNYFMVNGLQLCKTEAAFLALMGSGNSARIQ